MNLKITTAFKVLVPALLLCALNQGLQLHNLPSTDDQFLDIRASEVGVYVSCYHDTLYGFENDRNSQDIFLLPGTQ